MVICREPYALELPEVEAQTSYDTAKKQYYANNKQAPMWRERHLSHLDGLARAIAADKDTLFKSERKNLILIEKTRKTHRRISNVTKAARGGMVTKLFKTVTNGTGQTQTTEHTEQKDMEEACLAEGTARMTQNHVTPFCQPPLRDLLGPYPSETDVQSILYGIYEIPPNTDPHAIRLLQALKLPKKIFTEEGTRSPDSILPATITEAEHKAQWKRKKEVTAAEPSGLSFTHYKAGSYDDDINAIDTFLRNTPRKHGFPPLHGSQSLISQS